jgi:hypothetical protein
MGYWRGGGIYLSNGYLELRSSTVVENEVRGTPRTDSLGRRNLAGGIAATVGNAHAVERMTIGHSVIAGNYVQETAGSRYPHDIFTGSLMYFRSAGHNRIGAIDFSQILVPVGEWGWESLSRRHFPQAGDESDVELASIVDLAGGVAVSPTIVSAGVDAGEPAVLSYEPRGSALDQVLPTAYDVPETLAEYSVGNGGTDDFLAIVLARLERHYGLAGFASAFRTDFETFLRTADSDAVTEGVQPYRDPDGRPILTLADTHFFGPAATWPRELENHPYIEFWHRLDAALAQAGISGMGPELLGDAAWRSLFDSGDLAENPSIHLRVRTGGDFTVRRLETDQRGAARPAGAPGDIGAVELR